MTVIWYFLLLMNGIGFLIMGLDKRKARRRQHRIPEKTLWMVSLLGGTLGTMIGMYFFRHKTKHAVFALGLPILTLVYSGILLYFL